MKTSILVSMLALAVSITARAEPAPAPDGDRKHLLVEVHVMGEVTQIVDVRMDYGVAAATPGSQDIFFVEGLNRQSFTVSRVAMPNPLELRVYKEEEIVLAPFPGSSSPVIPVRPPIAGGIPILPIEPQQPHTPHRVEMLAEHTFKVAVPFHYALTTIRSGFTGAKEIVTFDARSVIRDFCSRRKGDGECSEWLAGNPVRR